MAWTKGTAEVPQAQSAMTLKSSSKDGWGRGVEGAGAIVGPHLSGDEG